jgi:hypothetical protein
MQLKEFKEKFKEIKAKGFIRSTRRGPTGIGHTLETLLGIAENNIASPDLGKIELKAHRNTGNSLITLFTFNNKVWKMPILDAVKQYGSLDKDGRQGLYYTMSLKPNSAGLYLDVTESEIAVKHISGQVVAIWNLQRLMERFLQKMPALIFVSAFVEERDNVEYFKFYRAQLMQGTSPELLYNQFKDENIVVDLRSHDQGTRARNHGTGFRAYENKLSSLFKYIEYLD